MMFCTGFGLFLIGFIVAELFWDDDNNLLTSLCGAFEVAGIAVMVASVVWFLSRVLP